LCFKIVLKSRVLRLFGWGVVVLKWILKLLELVLEFLDPVSEWF